MDTLLTDMGQRILQLRKSKHLTQEALANLAGVTYQTISTAELGKKALLPENIIRISQALEVSTDYLLTGHRTRVDYAILHPKLADVDAVKFDQIMRVIAIMLEE